MSLWRQFTRGVRVLFNRDAADRDIVDEVQQFLDQATAEGRARGLAPEDARRAARLEVGNPTAMREQVRGYGWENVITTFVSDVRYGLRRLRGSPGFAAVTVLTLALGIGATTSIFSAVNPILFEPLPYAQARQIMMIWYGADDGARASQTFGTYRELIARSHAFEALAVFRPWQATMTGPEEPTRFDGQRVTASYFHVLGASPALGQDFNPADDLPHGSNVVILSHTLWQRRFGGDASIVGRQITLNDSPYTVIGVMPLGFENVLSPSAGVWSLLQYDPSLPAQGREWGHHLHMVGRLRPGTGIDRARQELDAIAHAPVRDFPRQPWASMKHGLMVNSLQEEVTRGVRPALLVVGGAVLLVLIMACANVTNLLLARGAQRRAEFAMRVALGAARSRLICHLLTESLLLGAIAGLLGLAIANIGVRALVALSPPELPRIGAIGVNGSVFAFALAISVLTGLAVGLMPALYVSRGDLHVGLQEHSRRAAGHRQLTRGTLVVAEVAIALVLLVGAGLLFRSLERLFAIAPGFDPSNLLTMQVQITSPRRFPDDQAFHRFYEQALDAARRVPGVATAAFTSELPLSGDDNSFDEYGVQVEQRSNAPPERVDANRYAVTAGYFETMGIPLRHGRLFGERDMRPAPVRPVIVSESFARRAFSDQDPIGRRIRFGGPANRLWDVVVGVVGDVKQTSLAATNLDAVYVTTSQWLWAETPLWLVVRARGDAATLAPPIRETVWSVDKDQPIVRSATMDQRLASSEADRHFALIVFEAFGLMALSLATVGIYGVLSGSVTERTREIGVRSALGASRRDILTLIVGQGLTLTALGISIGLVAATAASRALVTLLFGVGRVDPTTYGGVVALLLGVSAIACWFPAWRAARVDPSITLRAE